MARDERACHRMAREIAALRRRRLVSLCEESYLFTRNNTPSSFLVLFMAYPSPSSSIVHHSQMLLYSIIADHLGIHSKALGCVLKR